MYIATFNMSFYMSKLDMYTIDAIKKGIRTATTRGYPNEINLIKSLVPGQPVRFIRTNRKDEVLDSIIVFADTKNNKNEVGYKLLPFHIFMSDLDIIQEWCKLEGWDQRFAVDYFYSNKHKDLWQFTYSLYPPNYNYSPDNITELKEGEIFVFGSNQNGFHGKGAAKQAMKFGAVYGDPQGPQGDTYAIITTDLTKDYRPSVDLQVVKDGVNKFLQDAVNNPHLTFLVTEIGCGLAGFTVEQIAPLFKSVLLDKVSNVRLPKSFVRELIVSSIESLI